MGGVATKLLNLIPGIGPIIASAIGGGTLPASLHGQAGLDALAVALPALRGITSRGRGGMWDRSRGRYAKAPAEVVEATLRAAFEHSVPRGQTWTLTELNEAIKQENENPAPHKLTFIRQRARRMLAHLRWPATGRAPGRSAALAPWRAWLAEARLRERRLPAETNAGYMRRLGEQYRAERGAVEGTEYEYAPAP